MPHQRLLKKLDHYGVRGNTFDWIRAFRHTGHNRLQLKWPRQKASEVLSGVPQGTVLGPLLFLVFIIDLPDCVQSKIRLFADDCIPYRRIKNQSDCTILQDDQNSLAEWEKKWGMAFHPEKCSAIRVTRSRKPISSNYSLKGHTLEMEDSPDSNQYMPVEISLKPQNSFFLKLGLSKQNGVWLVTDACRWLGLP